MVCLRANPPEADKQLFAPTKGLNIRRAQSIVPLRGGTISSVGGQAHRFAPTGKEKIFRGVQGFPPEAGKPSIGLPEAGKRASVIMRKNMFICFGLLRVYVL